MKQRLAGMVSGLGVMAFAAALAAGDDWPRFRGPDGLGRSTASDLPTTWSDTEHLLWRTPLPGPGSSSPIVWGDRLYLTCYTDYGLSKDEPGERTDLRRLLLCVDRQTGEIVWTTDESDNACATSYDGFVGLHGYASSTLATDGKAVYAFFGCSGVFAYDMEGTRLWRTKVGDRNDSFGSGTSPILFENLVIVNASVESRSVVALDRKTGEEVWRAEGVIRAWNTPIIVTPESGDPELVIGMKHKFKGFDPRTGQELWVCDGVRDYVCPSVVAHEGTVYAIGGRRGMAVAIRTGGRGDVTESHRLWEQRVGSNVPSPVYHDGHLYWLDHKGIAFVLDAKTGETVTRRRESDVGRTYASLTYGDGKLYAVSRENGTFVFDAEPSLPQIAHNLFAEDDSIFNGSPALLDGHIYLRSDHFLYCIGL